MFDPRNFLGGATPAVPVIITETSGKFRPIVLYGSALPREGRYTSFGGEQRGKTTYYAGNPEPTSQSLGPAEEPIRFGGLLEDHRLGGPGRAYALVALIDSVRKAGRTCIFSWGPLLRTVRWSKSLFTPIELGRYEYEIELEVLSDGLSTARRVIRTLKSVPGFGAAETALDGVASALSGLPAAVGVSALASSSAAVEDAKALVSSSSGDLQATAIPTTMRATSALTKLRAAQESVGDAEAGSRALDWKAAGTPSLAHLAGVGLPVLAARSQLQDAAVDLRKKTPRVRSLAQQDEAGSVLYVTARGDTLRRIAQRFYGTADRWGEILVDNDLSSPEIEPGTTLRLRRVPDPDKTSHEAQPLL